MRPLVLTMLSMSPAALLANHLAGGYINYHCINDSTIWVECYLINDCSPGNDPLPTAITLELVDDSTGLVVGSATFSKQQIGPTWPIEPCVPPCLCVEISLYEGPLVIPDGSTKGFWLTYKDCCRTGTATNLVNPLAQGMRIYTRIPNPDYGGCNNSAEYHSVPPLSWCTLYPVDFMHDAFDADGDSLAYKLCDALGQPGPPTPPWPAVNYSSPYNGTYPMASSPVISIDAVTGEISGTPNSVGQWVVAFCIEEWRNGELIAESTMAVTICVTNNCGSASIQTLFEDTIAQCVGNTVSFTGYSGIATDLFWDFGDTSTLADTSNVQNPTYTYPGPGSYAITFISTSALCSDTAYATVIVKGNPLTVVATPDTTVCEGEIVLLKSFPSEPVEEYRWEPSSYVVDPDSQSTLMNALLTGSYMVRVTDSLGCDAYDSVFITVHPKPDANIIGLDGTYTTASPPDTISGNPPGGTFSGPGMLGNVFDPSVAGTGTHIIYYSYTDSLGCTGVDSQQVMVDSATGIAYSSQNFTLHPNPTSGILTMTMSQPAQRVLRIYAAAGVLRLEAEVRSDIILSVDHLPTGTYLVQLVGQDRAWQRLIILGD